MLSIRSSMYLTGRPVARAPSAASTATLCRNNLLPKLPPASTGTRLTWWLRDLERGSDREADVIVHRAVDVDRELLRSLVETGDRAAGFDRLSAGTRPAQVALDHVGGLRELLLHRPEHIVAMLGDVVRAALGMEHRVAVGIDRIHHVGHRRQRLVVDLDEADGIFGDVAAYRRRPAPPARRHAAPCRARCSVARPAGWRSTAAVRFPSPHPRR